MSKIKNIWGLVEFFFEHLFVIACILLSSIGYLAFFVYLLVGKQGELRWQLTALATVSIAFIAAILVSRIGRQSLKTGASFAKDMFLGNNKLSDEEPAE